MDLKNQERLTIGNFTIENEKGQTLNLTLVPTCNPANPICEFSTERWTVESPSELQDTFNNLFQVLRKFTKEN